MNPILLGVRVRGPGFLKQAPTLVRVLVMQLGLNFHGKGSI